MVVSSRGGKEEAFKPVSPGPPLNDHMVVIPSDGIDDLTALFIDMILVYEVPDCQRC